MRKVRQHFKLSQKDFGKKIFLSQDQISLIEMGKRTPTDRTLFLLYEVYGINKEWFETGKGRMFNTDVEKIKDLAVSHDVKEIIDLLVQLDQEDQDRIYKIIESFLQK
ncbi:helix-turn-helix domain-containing protein [Clostridium sp.]|uniref:helix-turn-helix domain-containing protein n=1 Tax=Clostridium sp. TaxID=1506 RepID=UPI003F3F2F2E